ncbi:hypothetical protein JCM21900_003458 [Sporobolomyces salmonicolor]
MARVRLTAIRAQQAAIAGNADPSGPQQSPSHVAPWTSDREEQPQLQDVAPRTADSGGDYSYGPSEGGNYGYGASEAQSLPEPGWNADYSLSGKGTIGRSPSYFSGYDEPTSRALISNTAHLRSSSAVPSRWSQQPDDHDLPPLPPSPAVYTTPPLAQEARVFDSFSSGMPDEPGDHDSEDVVHDSQFVIKFSDPFVTPSQVRHETRYVPSNPKETRQRSIDEGKTSGEAQRPGKGNKGTRGADHGHEYDEKEKYGYDGKASTIDLVESLDYSSERKGSYPEEPVAKLTRKGGPTISKGDVPFEETSEFLEEASLRLNASRFSGLLSDDEHALQVSNLQSAVREANNWIKSIHDLNKRCLALPSAEDSQAVALKEEQTDATAATRALFTTLRNRLHVLDQGNANLRALIPLGHSLYNFSLADVDARQQQVDALKDRFKEVIQHYAEVERDNRAQHRARLAKQVRIVNPILTEEEIDDIVKHADAGDGAVFAQAVHTKDYRSYAARGALCEVETRAAELARIEETLSELAQVFQDMEVVVKAQNVSIVKVEADAARTHKDVEVGFKSTEAAVVNARSARKKRWCCFFLLLVLLIIVSVVTVVIVFEVILPAVHNKHKSSGPAVTTPAAASTSQSRSLLAASVKSNLILPPSMSSTSSPVNTSTSSTASIAPAVSTTAPAASTYTFDRSAASRSSHASSLNTASDSDIALSLGVKHSASVKSIARVKSISSIESLSSTKRNEEVERRPSARTSTSPRSSSSARSRSVESKNTAAA